MLVSGSVPTWPWQNFLPESLMTKEWNTRPFVSLSHLRLSSMSIKRVLFLKRTRRLSSIQNPTRKFGPQGHMGAPEAATRTCRASAAPSPSNWRSQVVASFISSIGMFLRLAVCCRSAFRNVLGLNRWPRFSELPLEGKLPDFTALFRDGWAAMREKTAWRYAGGSSGPCEEQKAVQVSRGSKKAFKSARRRQAVC
jgi:hypothetical protein